MSNKAHRSVARRRVRRSAIALVPTTAVGGLTLAAGALPADAQPVLHVSPNGSGSNCTSSSPCSLAHAIEVAEPGTVIDLAQGTYAGPITLSESLTLMGAAQSTTIIKGGDPVVTVEGGNTVQISLLTIEGGNDDGEDFNSAGGIVNHGTLLLSNDLVTLNTETGDGAGALYNDGTATITNSVISKNRASSKEGSPGIVNVLDGKMTIQGSTITQNINTFTGLADGGGGPLEHAIANTGSEGFGCFFAEGCSTGGGALNFGLLNVYQSSFTSNRAYKGGGIANGGSLYLSGVTVNVNTAFKGGGIYNAGPSQAEVGLRNAGHEAGPINEGTTMIVGSTISNNRSFKGGGIYNDLNGVLTIRNSFGVDNNLATEDGGGIFNAGACDYQRNEGTKLGPNKLNPPSIGCETNGVLNLISTTVQGNIAYDGVGGGVDNAGSASLVNSLIDANKAWESGGGVYEADDGTSSLTTTGDSIHGNTPNNCSPSQAGCPS